VRVETASRRDNFCVSDTLVAPGPLPLGLKLAPNLILTSDILLTILSGLAPSNMVRSAELSSLLFL